jgi:dTDP-D-glucose 4,6-dehydratase
LTYAKKETLKTNIQLLNFEMAHPYGPRDDINKLIPKVITNLLRDAPHIPLVT